MKLGDVTLQVNLPAKAVVRAMLERCLEVLPEGEAAAAMPPRRFDSPPAAIGSSWQGGTYAGLTLHDGKPAHLVLLPGDEELRWDAAVAWAKDQGGELPSRIDQLVLWQNLKSEFKSEAYWSGTQHADGASCAWYQGFGNGGQSSARKGYELRARAVRRLPIE